MYARCRASGAAWALVLLVGVVPAHAQADAVVRGRVVASADGSALSGAVVTIKRDATPPGRVVTGDEGGFILPQVRPGRQVVRVERIGFVPREVGFDVEPREVRELIVALDLAPISTTVDVTTESSTVSTHSPSSTVLSAARLAAIPPAEQTSLPDAMVTLAPGMIRGHDDFVHVRGQEMALNPIINGIAFLENPHALFSSGISPEIIETANVMTGAFPAEYGNRFGGVVDIVTKSGATMGNSGSTSARAGQAGRHALSGEFGGQAGAFGYYAFGSAFASDRFLSPPDVRAIHDRGTGLRAFFQADWSLAAAGALRVVGAGDRTSFQIPRSTLDEELRPQARPEQETRQETVIATWNRASNTVLTSVSGYQRASSNQLMPAHGPLTAAARLRRDLSTLGAKMDVTRASGAHTWKAGIDAVRFRPSEELRYEYSGYRELTHLLGLPHIHVHDNVIAFSGRDAGSQVSGYVQDSVRFGAVAADLGIRVDRHEMMVDGHATHASPRINLAIQASETATVHASYNRFFVPPPVEGVLMNSAGLTSHISEIGGPLPAIEPAIEDQVELGVTLIFDPVRMVTTGYIRRTNNPVHTTVWPDSRIYSYASFERGEAYGLEIKAEAPGLARFGMTAYANYALGRAWFFDPVTGGFVTEAAHVSDRNRFLAPMDQTHTVTGGISYAHARSGVWAGTTVEYGSGTPIGHGAADHSHSADEAAQHATSRATSTRVPSHATGNIALGIDLFRGQPRARLSIRLDIENVANNPYLIAQEGEFAPRQYSPPRLLSLTAKYRF